MDSTYENCTCIGNEVKDISGSLLKVQGDPRSLAMKETDSVAAFHE